MNHFKFILPVKTYIRKYIESSYGDPTIINLSTDVGFVVLNTLASRMENKLGKGNIDLFQNRFVDKVIFRIPFHYFSLTKKEVSPHTVVLLNRYFENKFDHDMNVFISNSNVPYGTQIKTGIEKFLAIHNIEMDVDVTYEALSKSLYRYSKNLSKKFSRSLSEERTRAIA